ncbi:peroxiredoxin [Paenibacillus allorhizosphaerae]|uniref:thioredoxin-dependent peroxiredoxin n=1 Tax=Paenibacillus allorhizosphaerae TaxID=2849866 RepID=A0ABN7TQ31_9BACL|nr:peroxiredoxin [Paenibacillus allorhizosphaerae]CAG7650723.1 Putative peroxiredoxin bcp [Paenibacillus allorhizosphaerae]
MLAIGTPAPAFTAESTQGTVRLEDVLGKRPVVLIFYPKDETPICTKQLCAVRDSKAQYAEYDALVIGVNPGTMAEHRNFAEKFTYDFPLVADEGERIRGLYDVGHTLFGLLGQQRIVYVIDQSATIVYAKKGNRPTREIVEALAAGLNRSD